jgi:pyridoxal 5'-phosphate synthase glutaminase subunit Pdx2
VKAGVLALQGDYAAHATVLRAHGAEVALVRTPGALRDVSAVVLPGGESTTLLRLMDGAPWAEELVALQARGGAILGTCAGAIVLARSVVPTQKSLGLLDVEIERNAYGRQVDSFEADVDAAPPYGPVRGTFIRAPRIRSVGRDVEVAGTLRGEPVLVRQGRVLAATFHPELDGANPVHHVLLRLATGEVPLTTADDYQISTAPERLDLDVIHGFLTQCYWARGIPRDTVARSLKGSLCFGVYRGGRQVGFARVITDRATFAYVADVFVLREHRGRGLGKRLLAAIKAHPELQGLRRWLLGTRDAHGLYRQFGFVAPPDPSLWMEIHRQDVYRA